MKHTLDLRDETAPANTTFLHLTYATIRGAFALQPGPRRRADYDRKGATPEIFGAPFARDATRKARKAANAPIGLERIMPLSKRALVIEGEQALRSSLSPLFQNSGLDLYGAGSMEDARALLPVLKPAVTIVDRELRDGDGLDLVVEAVQSGAQALIVSTHNSSEDRIKALLLGAQEYLAKPADPEEVYLRVRNMLATQSPSHLDRGMVREFGGVRVDLTSRAVLRADGSHLDELTETELAVLRMLAENADRIVSRESLHPVVTGAVADGKPTRAIDTCVSRLRIKLRAADSGAEIRSVRQAGYLFRRERSARGVNG